MKRLGCLCILLLCCFALAARAEVDIWFFDVGQGDSALIISQGHAMLIDGGSAENSSFLYATLKNEFGITQFDAVVATHPHDDHIGGLAGALNACTTQRLYTSYLQYDSPPFEAMMRYAGDARIIQPNNLTFMKLGDCIVRLYLPQVESDSVNAHSIIVRVVDGENAFLFMGDADTQEEAALVAMTESGVDLSADVIKVGHHGSDTSSGFPLLFAVRPSTAIFSVGKGNSFGHPSVEIEMRFMNLPALILRTDKDGTIHCHSDGVSLTTITQHSRYQDSQLMEPAYIGNINSKVFHLPSCSSVSKMAEKNIVPLYSRDEAEYLGYKPCGKCNP